MQQHKLYEEHRFRVEQSIWHQLFVYCLQCILLYCCQHTKIYFISICFSQLSTEKLCTCKTLMFGLCATASGEKWWCAERKKRKKPKNVVRSEGEKLANATQTRISALVTLTSMCQTLLFRCYLPKNAFLRAAHAANFCRVPQRNTIFKIPLKSIIKSVQKFHWKNGIFLVQNDNLIVLQHLQCIFPDIKLSLRYRDQRKYSASTYFSVWKWIAHIFQASHPGNLMCSAHWESKHNC